MDPDTLHQSQKKHADQDKGSGVAHERKWNSRDRSEEDTHPYVLEHVGKKQSYDPSDNEPPGHISAIKGDKEALNQQEGKS